MKKNILIVEDNLGYARKLKDKLKDVTNVTIKTKIENACDYLLENPNIYCLLLDLYFDDEDGRELLQFVDENKINIKYKIILSKENDVNIIEKCYKYKIDCFFKKDGISVTEIGLYILNKIKKEHTLTITIEFNENDLSIKIKEKIYFLSFLEFNTLKKLVENSNSILHIDEFESIWKKDYINFSNKNLYNIIYKLKKIPELLKIESVKNVGYIYKD